MPHAGFAVDSQMVLVTQKSSPKSENVVCMTDRVHQRAAEAENYDLGHTVGHARIVSSGIAPEAQQVPLSISKVVAGPSNPDSVGKARGSVEPRGAAAVSRRR